MPSSRPTLTMVLGGGRGTRLYPLTALRAKPAVPLAGKYRLIDIPLSNAINSGLREIYVLTQFNSKSLNAHIARSYWFDPFSQGFVDILAANQTNASPDWFQGTADAVRQNLEHLDRHYEADVLILSGDHLYRMDYRPLIERHREQDADITVCCIPRDRPGCTGFGVLSVDDTGLIRAFQEKPALDEDISHLETPPPVRRSWGMPDEKPFLASMGVYVFKLSALRELLKDEKRMDFGKHVIPDTLESHRVAAYMFDGYWEDIGTIRSFYEANLMLCDEDSPFRFHREGAPIYSRQRFLPASRFTNVKVERSMISDGCVVRGATIKHSVIGLRTRICPGVRIEDSLILGADYYEDEPDVLLAKGCVPIGIGEGASIKEAIIDKDARIGAGAVIHGARDRHDENHDHWAVRDGIVVVRKRAVILPGTVL